MYPYQNPDLSTEERISDLMSRMTLEEKILQTDQYYSGDFTTQDENGKVTAVDMQRFDALMQHNSVGSVQLRGMTATYWWELLKFCVRMMSISSLPNVT